MADSSDIQHSRSNDSLFSLGTRLKRSVDRIPHTDAPGYSLKHMQTEKRFLTNLSASRIDELTKRIHEQDLIIADQTKRINELEHKLTILIDILERNNNIWFHRELLRQGPAVIDK